MDFSYDKYCEFTIFMFLSTALMAVMFGGKRPQAVFSPNPYPLTQWGILNEVIIIYPGYCMYYEILILAFLNLL
jgi:hypothetical protein